MKKLLLFALFFATTFNYFAQEKYSKVKIYATNLQLSEIANLGIAVDHGQRKNDTWLVTDISQSQIETLENNGFEIDIEIDNVTQYYIQRNLDADTKDDERADCGQAANSGFTAATPVNFQLGSMAGFYTYQEFIAEIDAMAVAYPNLITAKSPISTFTTHEGRPVYWLRISDNPNVDEAENEVLYSALHHAREPASLSQLIFYMWYLLENYGTNDEVTYLLDNTEMYFVPMLNPDGYVHNVVNDPNGGGMHRKNKRNVGTNNPGVDLNRNYAYHWDESGTSPNTNNDTYAGTNAFSEPETQAMKWFCENRNFEFAHNAHSYGNLLLYPIGWANNEFAPDHDYFEAFTSHQVLQNGFNNMKSSGLYPAAGDSDDWMYIDGLATKPKIYALTPEVGGGDDGFWPTQGRILPICESTVWMNLILAHLPHIYGATTDIDPNKIGTYSGYFHYEIQRLGLEDGDINVSMQAISGIQTLGGLNTHTLNLMDIDSDSISFVLDPALVFGDEIVYVLKTDNGSWTRNDTVTKTFGTGIALFTDDCNTLANWTGDWGTTTEYYVSAGSCITDSPNSDYSNSDETEIVLNNILTLQNSTYAYAQFYAKWNIENDYDFVEFMISTDNGSSWTPLCGKYTNEGTNNQDAGNPLYDGNQNNWVLEEVDLSDYLGMNNVRFKFRLKSDNWEKDDGFSFDDFNIYTDGFEGGGIEHFNDSDFSLYPNPSNSLVSIYTSGVNNIQQIEIYNNLGQKVGSVNNTSSKTTVDVSKYNAGVYFVKITTNTNQIITKKFSVIK
jgi:carboxypeptidase T